MNRGKVFEAELKSSLECTGFTVMRIADRVYFDGHAIKSEQTPADFLAWYPAEHVECFMFEAKATGEKRIDFDRVQPHQEQALLDFDSTHADMHGYVAVNFYNKENIRSFNQMYFVPISTWVELKGSLDRKSLPFDVCEDNEDIIKCVRVKGSVYDVSPLLTAI